MIHQCLRPAELAQCLNTTPHEVDRLTKIRDATGIDGTAALTALGWHLELGVA